MLKRSSARVRLVPLTLFKSFCFYISMARSQSKYAFCETIYSALETSETIQSIFDRPK